MENSLITIVDGDEGFRNALDNLFKSTGYRVMFINYKHTDGAVNSGTAMRTMQIRTRKPVKDRRSLFKNDMIDELRSELRLINKIIATLMRLSGLRQTKQGAKRPCFD